MCKNRTACGCRRCCGDLLKCIVSEHGYSGIITRLSVRNVGQCDVTHLWVVVRAVIEAEQDELDATIAVLEREIRAQDLRANEALERRRLVQFVQRGRVSRAVVVRRLIVTLDFV